MSNQFYFNSNFSFLSKYLKLFISGILLLFIMTIAGFSLNADSRTYINPKTSIEQGRNENKTTKNKQSIARKNKSLSGLEIPRFVSLKSNKVNVRKGPGTQYQVSWVFLRQNLPVEVFNEFGNWRLIRDSDAQEGWIYHTLLSGNRTAIIAPWQKGNNVIFLTQPHNDAEPLASIEPGTIGKILKCSTRWCKLNVKGYSGYLLKEKLWGVYPEEEIK